MTGRVLPAAATAAVCVAVTGLLVHLLTPAPTRHSDRRPAADASVPVPPGLLIRTATQHAHQLLQCPPADRHVAAGAAPRRVTCGHLAVLRVQPSIDSTGAATVLLIGLLRPEPGNGEGVGQQPIPIALRLQIRRSPAGTLTAEVIGP